MLTKPMKLFGLVLVLHILSGCQVMDFSDTNTSNDNAYTNSEAEPGNDTLIPNEEACAYTYFKERISGMLQECLGCHNSKGIAQNSKLVFDNQKGLYSKERYNVLREYLLVSGTTIIHKNDGTLNHAGGTLFDADTSKNVQTFIDYVTHIRVCKNPTDFIENTRTQTLASAQQTLTLFSMRVLNRFPSNRELAQASDTDGLNQVLDAYMHEDAFYNWIRRSMNDVFLIDGLERSNTVTAFRGTQFSSTATWFNVFKKTKVGAFPTARNATGYGLKKAPLELVVHILKNNRPFSEILTADYTMVNPYSARSYGIRDRFAMSDNPDEFSKYDKYTFKAVKLETLPMAGILSDKMFLYRYPSTNTNKNRHRASVVQKMFLNTDIESLSSRPVNPDSGNVSNPHPTLNNPNCTICHVVMEPIAGAFKNYSNKSAYRVRTWDKYMQKPGFDINTPLPEARSSTALQWLAQQIVKDPRFARSVTHMFYTALTGRKPLKLGTQKPSKELLEAIAFEDGYFSQAQQAFIDSNMDARVLIKSLVNSPLFRSVSSNSSNVYINQSLSNSFLLTPEGLDEKIKNLTGYYWTKDKAYYRQASTQQEHGLGHYLLDDFKVTYGGIDSMDTVQRVRNTNALMASIQLRMGIEMGSRMAPIEFFYSRKLRKLFPYVEKDTEPVDTESVWQIKRNIVYLFKYLLNETYGVDDDEVAKVYELFESSLSSGQMAISQGDTSTQLNFPVTIDPNTGASLQNNQRVEKDPRFVIRSWALVLSYMLSDYRFTHSVL